MIVFFTVRRTLQSPLFVAHIIGVPFQHRVHRDTQGERGWWVGKDNCLDQKHSLLMLTIYFPISEKEDNFDWAQYLMEGEDFDTGPYPDTPVSHL